MRRLTDTDGLTDGIVTRLKELGVFGLTIDEQYGGLGESLLTYALVVEELARGWRTPASRTATSPRS